MSKRLAVLSAIKALLTAALPTATVRGLDGDEAPPATVPAGGLVVVRTGDPGPPAEVTLSPLTYWWEHDIPVEVTAQKGAGRSAEQAIDAMLVLIGAAIAADRTLGGLCDWIDISAAATGDVGPDQGGSPPRGADLTITATYSSLNPLA